MGGVEPLHAALLIDFDNVTMGMRSDLSKELKSLLDSDVIKGKVSVQRAYADWRRYPQYIVPLSEASVDLIFAPAYGSNKKNATDIRMAIDALELVFIRPEIGTYILLTGDSDFSSLVLKLKEYGKYVIGVGIQESSSDILVQNCDEYYSYTSLTGLTKTTDLQRNAQDPWVLVKDAVARMVQRGDVMRSDRLKQVMQEIDASFDEGSLGYSKFSKFLAEASSRGLLKLRKLENGQYEISSARGRVRGPENGGRTRRRGGRRDRRDRQGAQGDELSAVAQRSERADADAGADPLQDAYDLLVDSLEALRDAGREPVRDSDVKRKLLEHDASFDETELGFPKFSRFLQQAAEHGVIRIERTEGGNLAVALAGSGAEGARAYSEEPTSEHSEAEAASAEAPMEAPAGGFDDTDDYDYEYDDQDIDEVPEHGGVEEVTPSSGPVVIDVTPPEDQGGLRLGPRRGSTRRRGGEEPPPFFEGQAARGRGAAAPTGHERDESAHRSPGPDGGPAGRAAPSASGTSGSIEGLGLPSDPGAIVRYLSHRYKGVGEKTAEILVEHFGSQLFATLHSDPDAILEVVPRRGEQVLEAWRSDYARRTGGETGGAEGGSGNGRRRGRGRGRGRG